MATQPDQDLRDRLKGEPGVTPEDTRDELREDLQSQQLRSELRGDPAVTPEDTKSELLERAGDAGMAAKEERKAQESEDMKAEREEVARSWTPAQAEARARQDIDEHAELAKQGARGESESFYLRSDMAERVKVSSAYAGALGRLDPQLLAAVNDLENDDVTVELRTARPPAEPGTVRAEAAVSREDAKEADERSPVTVELVDAKDARHEVGEGLVGKPQGFTPPAAGAAAAEVKPKGTAERQAEANAELDDVVAAAQEEGVRRRQAREQIDVAQGANAVDVTQRTGKELARGEFIMPRRITQTYTEVEGKFYAKDSKTRVMFEDKGERLATSATDKSTVADMVALARAKQWESLKLTGSQEFRREAWLQAESQGIKTQGYTPKPQDLAELEALRQERATNSITPLAERNAARTAPATEASAEVKAPRHNVNKNQAELHQAASLNVTANMHALQGKPGMAEKTTEELAKLAYWRGVVAEENKGQPEKVKEEALARFDAHAADPDFAKRLETVTEPKVAEKTTQRVQQREPEGHSL